MNKEDFSTLWKMLTGVWPKLDTDEAVAAWWGLLGHYPAHQTTSSVRKWATGKRNAPTPADIIEGVRAIVAEQRSVDRHPSINAAKCYECAGTGFTWTSLEGHGTLARCTAKCLPPVVYPFDREQDGSKMNNAEWVKSLQKNAASLAAHRTKVGESAYLKERGYDPEKFRIQQGMIIARPGQ